MYIGVCACTCMLWLIHGDYMFCVFVLCMVLLWIHICKQTNTWQKKLHVLACASLIIHHIQGFSLVYVQIMHTHTLCACALPIHTRTYTTNAPCVCVVYVRVCVGNAHTRCARCACRQHVLSACSALCQYTFIYTNIPLAKHIACTCMCVPLHTPRAWCLRGVYIGDANTHERVCAQPKHTRNNTTHAPCVCVV